MLYESYNGIVPLTEDYSETYGVIMNEYFNYRNILENDYNLSARDRLIYEAKAEVLYEFGIEDIINAIGKIIELILTIVGQVISLIAHVFKSIVNLFTDAGGESTVISRAKEVAKNDTEKITKEEVEAAKNENTNESYFDYDDLEIFREDKHEDNRIREASKYRNKVLKVLTNKGIPWVFSSNIDKIFGAFDKNALDKLRSISDYKYVPDFYDGYKDRINDGYLTVQAPKIVKISKSMNPDGSNYTSAVIDLLQDLGKETDRYIIGTNILEIANYCETSIKEIKDYMRNISDFDRSTKETISGLRVAVNKFNDSGFDVSYLKQIKTILKAVQNDQRIIMQISKLCSIHSTIATRVLVILGVEKSAINAYKYKAF